jgi:hypothetical protein
MSVQNDFVKFDLRFSNSLGDLAARIRSEHEATAAAMKRGVGHAIAAGGLLIEAKAQLKHGEWLPWLTEHCAMSDRTARLYMRLARNKAEIEIGNVADLNLRGALALITLPSDGPVAKLGDGVANMADDEAIIAACEKSIAERTIRKAIFDDIVAALTQLRPDTVEADRELGDLVSAIRDITSALLADADVPFACSPQATIAADKARKIAVELLRRKAVAA